MKKIKIFRVIGAALAGVSLLMAAGCSNLFESVEKENSYQVQTQKGRLVFSVSSSARAASTVNPSGFDFTKDSGLTFTLTGTLSGTTSTLGTWSDSGETKAYAAMSADSSILIDTGSWTFNLNVTKDGKDILYGTKTLEIVGGDNTLDFGELSEASGENAAEGNVSFTLTFPLDAAKGAAATLTSVDAQTAGEETSLEVISGVEKSCVTYTKSADAGSYILAIKLYSSMDTKDSSTYLNTYTALVNVAPGQKSEGSAELTDLNALYKITYELNGGSLEEGSATSLTYNNHAKVTLPNPARTGYTFAGWSKTSLVGLVETTTIADYEAGAQITLSSDTTLYALWMKNEYKITYNVNLDNLSNVTNSNITTYTDKDDVTISDLTLADDDYIFCAWYEDEDFSTKTTGWKAGEKYGNITLYAKIDSAVIAQIKAMTESGTIKVSGEYSIDLIRKINKALKALAETSSDVLVTLDLSEVTGFTELEAASLDNQNCSFFWCENLAGIELPSTITSIGEYAFCGCTGLSTVTIPDSVTSVERSAFSSCNKLNTVYYKGTFEKWLEISFINIDSNPCCNGADLYIGGTKLTKVTFSDSLTEIGKYVLRGCTSVTEITIPSSITKIGDGAFNCVNNKTVNYTGTVKQWCEIEFADKNANPCKSMINGDFYINGTKIEGNYTIPDTVEEIGQYAFAGCKFVDLTIPSSVTMIGPCAFNYTSISYATIEGNNAGWQVQGYIESTKTFQKVTDKDFSSITPSTMATYLNSTYGSYRWMR